MLRYLLKRVALLVPTFFLISLVVFLVLNLAPGRPGASSEDPGQRGDKPCEPSADNPFRQQFHLDKPIFLNTRPWLTEDEVRSLLVTAYDVGGAAPKMV